MVSKLTICCTNTACNAEAAVSDPYFPESTSLNTRSVLGMQEIGRGKKSLESFCGVMDMLPPLSSPAYIEHNHHVADAAMAVALENMCAASAHLHKLQGVDPTTVLDITVTCDGTWSKRGHTATHGVVVVIAWETGQVLDFQIMTKRCMVCALKKTQLGEDCEEEFAKWFEGHEDKCQMNHEGSSPAMEMAGAVQIWKRSVETRYLRYTRVISDGDAKTVKHLNEIAPYGSEVEVSERSAEEGEQSEEEGEGSEEGGEGSEEGGEGSEEEGEGSEEEGEGSEKGDGGEKFQIEKLECVGHVQKRVGKRLREVKKSVAAVNRIPKQKMKKLKDELKAAKAKLRVKKGKTGRGRGRGKGKGKMGSRRKRRM